MAPKFEALSYTDRSLSLLYLLCFLAILFSPLINIIHGVYFVHKASSFHYFPHAYDRNGLTWNILLKSLLIWWLIKPLYIKKHSHLNWREVIHACKYLFMTFIFFTFPFITGIFGNIFNSLFSACFEALGLEIYWKNFLEFILSMTMGMAWGELMGLRCGHMIRNDDLFYWFCLESAIDACIVLASLVYVLGQQGYLVHRVFM